MNETEKAFREDFAILLDKYNASIYITTTGDYVAAHEIEVDCNPQSDCAPCATFYI